MPTIVFSKERCQSVTIYSYYVFSLYLIDTDGKLYFFTTDRELKPKEGWKITSLIYKNKEQQ